MNGARIGVDVGGTFTDVILHEPDGHVRVHKLLSTPPSYDRAVVEAVSGLAGSEGGSGIGEVVHGTTVATNAVLQRLGAETALVTTAHFRDVLELRRLRIPHMYDLFWAKPPPLVERRLRFEVAERMAADGTVVKPLDDDEVRALAGRLRELAIDSVAVCFLHSYLYPAHEERVGAILAEELPDATISLSSEILREQREYERSATTVVNAYVRPLMSSYIDRIRTGLDGIGLEEAPLAIMQSSGGVMTSDDAKLRPVFALESGPAAGVVAALGMAKQLGIENAIAFDMGGTTAKASLIEHGSISRGREYEVGGSISAGSRLIRGAGELLRIPTIDIAEVGAGGGSIAWLDPAGGLQVGPRSAGAAPGPACYGRGGVEPTVTDANVVLGFMPAGQVADGQITIQPELAEAAVQRLAEPLGLSVLEAAHGIHRIANARMTRALRSVSSEKGRDPRDFAIIAYGGSGPVHAGGLADDLGVTTVLVPPVAGLFSAVGLLFARPEFHEVRSCHLDVDEVDPARITSLLNEMETVLVSAFAGRAEPGWMRTADLRYGGQSWEIEVELPTGLVDRVLLDALRARFEDEHEVLYGVRGQPGSPVEVRAVRLAALGVTAVPPSFDVADAVVPDSHATRRMWLGREAADVPVRARGSIGADAEAGPMLVDEYDTTVVVPAGWTVHRHLETATLVLEREAAGAELRTVAPASDPITLQVVANALQSIADEMATTIIRTAHSTVVRDGMDFSSALCDAQGETVAQAVSVPFHLGSIPTAMESLLAHYGDRVRPGDVFIMNDPFDGGMHLQDIFIVKPVHLEGTLIGWAVTTAHHGDVGGRLPGSSACDNTEIYQEGLRMPWLRYHAEGEPVEEVHKLIEANMRIPRVTFGDLGAQVAACSVADRALQALAVRHGREALAALMIDLIDYTERLVRQEISTWPDGSATFTDYLGSDGIEARDVPIVASVTIQGDEVIADLTESSPMVRGSLNSTRSFVMACVYQAIRCALTLEIPNTAGAFRPITVLTKPGTVAEVVMPAASSMRGVTGFRVLDALNGALAQLIPGRIPAAGEGGNTLAIFGADRPEGGDRFVFYELVVGTWGGTPCGDGNDGLTNPASLAANIPIEVAESEFPIVVERYGLVRDTGGAGEHRGGLAIERIWRCLTPGTSLIVRSDRADRPPYGLAGGGTGGTSSNVLIHPDGSEEVLPAMFSTTIETGDVYAHRMAGGGGWGDPLARDPTAVAEDVADDKVSVEAARELYGVVIGADGTADVDATADLRGERRGT